MNFRTPPTPNFNRISEVKYNLTVLENVQTVESHTKNILHVCFYDSYSIVKTVSKAIESVEIKSFYPSILKRTGIYRPPLYPVKVTEWPPIGKIAAHSACDMFHGMGT